MAFLDNFAPEKQKSFFDNFQAPSASGGSYSPDFSKGIDLTNQNFSIGGSSTPAFTTTNITPTSVFKSVVNGVKKIPGIVASIPKMAAQDLVVTPIVKATQMSQSFLDRVFGQQVPSDQTLFGTGEEDVTIKTIFGEYTVPAQKTFAGEGDSGLGATKQITGQALNSLSWLIAPEKLVGIGKGIVSNASVQAIKTGGDIFTEQVVKDIFTNTIKKGFQEGALVGSIQAAGQSFSQGKDAIDIIKDTAIGAVFGGALGVATSGSIAGIQIVRNKAKFIEDTLVKEFMAKGMPEAQAREFATQGGFIKNPIGGEVPKKKMTDYPYSLKNTKGVDTVYHETDPSMARTLTFGGIDKNGLNVATSPELALGQKGKGVTLEIDGSRLEGRGIKKPGSDFVAGQSGKWPEYEITNAPHSMKNDVKSATFEPNVKKIYQDPYIKSGWTKEVLPDGKIKYSNPSFKTGVGQPELPQGKLPSLPESSSPTVPSSDQIPSQINVSSPNITPEVDPVKQITDALKAAKPIRKEQEALYSAERGKRVGAIVNIGKNTSGEKGYFAQLGALKGELPKAQFESIRKNVTQENVDKLFDMVEKANVTPFEKINAKSGLSKILGAEGGSVPTKNEIELLSEIFPADFIKTVMDQRPLTTKLWGTVKDALNLPRAIMAAADLSGPLRQGIMLVGKPKQWAPAFAKMFKYAFSEDAYKGLMTDIQSRPNYQLMRENKLALTEVGEVLSKREESFMSNLTERIPLFGRLAKASNRAYSGFLNKLRADTFDDLVNKATELGLTKDNPKLVADVAKFVNTATGRGDLPAILQGSTDLLNGAFFSPRLMASRLQSLNPVYYTKLDPFVRKEALKSLFTVTGIGLSVLGLAKLNGAEVSADPRSADFGKIKIGDTRYDPWGGFQQYVVLASRLLTGEMVNSTTGKEFKLGEGYKPTTRLDIIQRFFESKTSPIASFALGLLKGQTSTGEDLNIPADIADRFLPMIAQDMFDLYRENGPKGLGMAIPGIFGAGSQTYSDQVPMKTKTPTGKDSIKWRQAPNLGETLINKVTGKQITTIPEAEQQKLRDQKLVDTKREIDLTKAKSLVLETGEPQDVGDTHVFLDNGVVKTSTSENAVMYSKIQTLKESGKIEEAQSIIKAMTDKEYKDYDSYRKTRNTRTMNNFLKTDPAEAVKFVRAQSPAEQQRLLKTMNDTEYALYEQGKKILQ